VIQIPHGGKRLQDLTQYLVSPAQLPVIVLKLLHPLTLIAGKPGPEILVPERLVFGRVEMVRYQA